MLDLSLSQVIWAKHFFPFGLLEPPIDGPGGILHGTMNHYTLDTFPNFPIYRTTSHWGHYGLDKQTGGVKYGRYIRSYQHNISFPVDYFLFPPYMLPDGKLREMQAMGNDFDGEWNMIEVDTTGYLGCDQRSFTPILQADSVILDVLTGWTIDTVGSGVLNPSASPYFSFLAAQPLTIPCECYIDTSSIGSFSYQFSVLGAPVGSYQWDFGDGFQGTGININHTFPGIGTYLVTACRDFGCGVVCDTFSLSITCPLPVATYSQSVNLLSATFNSTGSQGNLLWQFGDGNTLRMPIRVNYAVRNIQCC